jgi:archaellin
MKYLLFIVLLVAVVITAGCVNQNTTVVTSPQTTMVPTITVTTVPSTVTSGNQTQKTEPVANIQIIGNVYGLASHPSDGIDEITFAIGLASGAPAIDLTKLQIIFSTPNTPPVPLIYATRASTSFFTTKIGTTKVTSLNPDDQVVINFIVDPVSANTKMDIVLIPPVGSKLTFTKTVPAKIAATNLLY